MTIIKLKPIQINGAEIIGLYFPMNTKINALLQKNASARWSKSERCWWVPMELASYEKVILALKGFAEIDSSMLNSCLQLKGNETNSQVRELKGTSFSLAFPGNRNELTKCNLPISETASRFVNNINPTSIHPINADVIPKMEQHLKLKGYSISTMKTYSNEMGVFLKTIKQHSAESFTVERLKDYLQYCSRQLKLTENTLHSRINALKFYYEQVLKRDKFFWDIPRPKKGNLLPNILSKQEMVRLLKAIENKKHKTMLMLGYACGLRVSEITSLEMQDIDTDRHLLFIRRAKGKRTEW